VLTTTADAVVNGVNIGIGGGAITSNTRVGINAGLNNTTGTQNSFFGNSAGGLNTTGSNNSFFGWRSGAGNTTGANNSFFGRNTGNLTVSGSGNSFFGMNAGTNNNGSDNSFFGLQAGLGNTSGESNIAVGSYTMQNNTTGGSNVGIGVFAGFNQTTGSENIFLGRASGQFIANGLTALTISANSVFLGARARANADNQTNQIVIGHTAIGLGSNTTVLGNTSTTFGRWFGNLLVGTSTNAASSILTMESTTQGFLPPRMTSTQRDAIASPAAGLVIYNTTTNLLNVYNGTMWI
jgi:hypothetical protein